MEIQLAVEANFATSVMVRTTMFDMLSAMAEIRKGLLAEHNAEILFRDLGIVLIQESLSYFRHSRQHVKHGGSHHD